MERFCRNCGVELKDKERKKYCPNCGASLDEGEKILEESVRDKGKKGEKKSAGKIGKRILLGLGIAAAVALAGVWLHDTRIYWTLKWEKMVTIIDAPTDKLSSGSYIKESYPEENLIIVTGYDESNDNAFGAINYDGEEVLPLQYEDIEVWPEAGRMIAETDSMVSLFDMEGRVIREVSSRGGYFIKEEGLMEYHTESDLYNIMDLNGNDVVKEVKNYGKLQIIDQVSRRRYEKKDNQWGLLDETGAEVVPCQYDSISDFADGVAVVKKGELEGAIDPWGNEILPCEYEYVDDYINGWTRARTQTGNILFFDTEGRQVINTADGPWKVIYGCLGGNYIEVGIGEGELYRHGIVTRDEYYSGDTVIPCEYDQIRWTGDLFIVCQSTRDTDGDEKKIWGAFNSAGERILPLEYDDWYNKGNANGDYYVFTKEYEEDVSVQVVLSKTGEKLGEYVGKYKREDECLGWIECPEEDNEVIVLGKDGQVAARWEYEEMRSGKEKLFFRLKNGKYAIGDLQTGQFTEIEGLGEKYRNYAFYPDGIIVWTYDNTNKLYTLDDNEARELFEIKGKVSSIGGRITLCEVTNPRWIFGKKKYWIKVKQ